MEDWLDIRPDEKHVKRERNKARELKKTSYFQNLLAQGICHYCKNKFPKEELTFDHIVPISRGGRSTKGNMVVACIKCNSEKKYYTPVEMLLNSENEN